MYIRISAITWRTVYQKASYLHASDWKHVDISACYLQYSGCRQSLGTYLPSYQCIVVREGETEIIFNIYTAHVHIYDKFIYI